MNVETAAGLIFVRQLGSGQQADLKPLAILQNCGRGEGNCSENRRPNHFSTNSPRIKLSMAIEIVIQAVVIHTIRMTISIRSRNPGWGP